MDLWKQICQAKRNGPKISLSDIIGGIFTQTMFRKSTWEGLLNILIMKFCVGCSQFKYSQFKYVELQLPKGQA